jgi:hypothetical protein
VKRDQLNADFLQLMQEIGDYGEEKHGENSMQFFLRNHPGQRPPTERTTSEGVIRHCVDHGRMYLRGELHDHFKTKRHQLAAIAFNAMMEYCFAGLENEDGSDPKTATLAHDRDNVVDALRARGYAVGSRD